MDNEIKPGAYRQLFLDALAGYRETAPPEKLPLIEHYAKLLRDPEYRFGKLNYHPSNYTSGELFLRS